MKIMLLKNISGLGKAGDIKEVADGYARNYLIKKNLAKSATETAIREVEMLKNKKEKQETDRKNKLIELSQILSQTTIKIKAKQKDGKLFGSINKKMIAEELKKQNFPMNEDLIILSKPIKEVGEYEVKIELGHKINTGIKVIIASEK
ncbi:MAG: 50S ribosomal protein L9 [Candidatus Moranbacteria bacterium RIFCSPHIGHO2_02_FULL_40_12b]|nr:MAG: 50S ribosomal protein L9 [Candidatus Moranbacteria bacterium RIFCSPHIGHO2_02_FULL_40_12b]OGI23466.1 MAG: 50S ribosomal protein L9 [Candidatus Moranbacteria bacterium RIFCSPHIGHO2_12_FULL_40_10]